MNATARLAAALVAAGLSACSVDLDPLEPGAKVTCSGDGDCPSGFFCSQALGNLCAPRGGSDQTTPTIVGTPTISPSAARAGTQVTVSFEVSEDLALDPVVRISGVAEPLGTPSRAGRVYTLEFPASTALGDGTKSIVATLVDLSANENQNALVGQLTLDFTPPSASAPTFSHVHARAGTPFTASFTFTEPLGDTPTLAIDGGPALTATAGPGANAWTFSRTMDGTEPAGPVDLVLDAADAAGNPLVLRYTEAVTLDFAVPTVTSATVGTPAVRAGDTFVAGLQFSEALGAAPAVTLVPTGAGAALPVTVSTLDAANYALSYDVPAGTPDGTYTLTLVSAADRAGNPAAAGPLGAAGGVRFDSAPPTVANLVPDRASRRYRAGQPVQVTFTLSEAPAATPDVRLELLPVPESLACTNAGLAYTCATAALSGTELPESVVNVSVTVADPAGNVATAGTSVVLDFTAPVVLSAEPGRAAFPANGTTGYTISVSEPLSASPTVAVSRGGTLVPGFFGAPSAQSATTFAWSRPVPTGVDGAYTVSISVTDEAGNAATSVPGTGFSVDTSFPAVTGGFTFAPVKAAWRAGDRPTLGFNVTEAIAAPAARLNTVPPVQATCTPAGPATAFSCQLDRALAATDLPEGATAFLVTLRDLADNVGYASIALTLDYTPPALASTPATRYLGSAATRGVDVRAVGQNSSWEISILTAEPLAGPPVLTAVAPVGGQTRTLTLTGSNAPVNTSFTYLLPSSTTAFAAATWSVRWNPSDRAGNTYASPQEIATVDVDGVVPPAPTTGTAAAPTLLWTRTPWGTDTSTAAVFEVSATSAAVGADADVMIAWDGSAASALEVARASPNGGGGFTVALGADPADLWVSTLDRAGNESARTRVVDVAWTAGLAGKVAGSTFENPHRLETRTRSLGALEQLDAVQVSSSALGLRTDGQIVTTTAASVWRPVGSLSDPGPRIYYSLGADAGRGVVVLYGGMLVDSSSPGDTWEWNGTEWRQVFPGDPEGDGNPPKSPLFSPLVYDPIRGGLVVFASTGLWLWNGSSWRKLTAVPAAGGAITWDSRRALFVFFDGFGVTWEWNGTAWRNAAPAVSPPARSFTTLYFDTEVERVCLYGGRTQAGTDLADAWCFDGGTWTQLAQAGTAPYARREYAVAWDASRKELFLHSGRPAGDATPEGRTYVMRRVSGTPTWFDVTPQVIGITQHAATYDPTSRRVVMLGNQNTSLYALRAWNGAAYSVLAPGDPEADGNPSFLFRTSNPVYVPARGRTVFAQAGTVLETWEWDRASWALRATGGGPPATSGLSAGYHGSNLITFGGWIAGFARRDTWSWNGTSWTQLIASPSRTGATTNDETFRADAGMATDPASGRLYRVGGYDNVFTTQHVTTCYLDVWEWTGATWTKLAGAPWNDPEGDGNPTTASLVYPPCSCREKTIWSPTLQTLLVYSNETGAIWEWRQATNSWARHAMTGLTPSTFQGFFWDTTLSAPVLVDFSGPYLVDLVSNTYVPIAVANPFGPTPPTGAAMAFDTGAGAAVAVEALPWVWQSPATGGPAQLFTVDYSRAGGPDPAVCLAGATCPIQRIDVTWTGGGTAPTGNGAKLQAWTGGWLDVASNGATAAAPALMTYTWTGASTIPAATLFGGAARELTFGLVPRGTTTAAGAARVGSDAVAVTIRYRRT